MRREQMFPPKHLSGSELLDYNPNGAIVTIEAVTFETIRSPRPGEPGIVYYLKFIEFKKTMKLTKFNAGVCFDTLGEDTEFWLGKIVRIFPIQILLPSSDGTQRPFWVINIDLMRPTTKPVLPPNSDITGYSANVAQHGQRAMLPGAAPRAALPAPAPKPEPERFTLARIGAAAANAFLAAAKAKGLNGDHFIAWLRIRDFDAFTHVHGRFVEDWSSELIPLMRSFLGGEPAEPKQDVVDFGTGEVIKPAEPQPAPQRLAPDGYSRVSDGNGGEMEVPF